MAPTTLEERRSLRAENPEIDERETSPEPPRTPTFFEEISDEDSGKEVEEETSPQHNAMWRLWDFVKGFTPPRVHLQRRMFRGLSFMAPKTDLEPKEDERDVPVEPRRDSRKGKGKGHTKGDMKSKGRRTTLPTRPTEREQDRAIHEEEVRQPHGSQREAGKGLFSEQLEGTSAIEEVHGLEAHEPEVQQRQVDTSRRDDHQRPSSYPQGSGLQVIKILPVRTQDDASRGRT